MKIHLISDLHLEHGDMTLPGGEVLLLAGDICEAIELGKNNYNPNYFPIAAMKLREDRFLRFFHEEVTKYQKAFYIAGNHEYWKSKFHKVHDLMRNNVPENTTVLDKDCFEYNGVLFIGATLWTNFNDRDPMTVYKSSIIMNDYAKITVKKNDVYRKMITSDVYEEHVHAMARIEQFLKTNNETDKLPVVVMSHHAPTMQSIPAYYRNKFEMNGNYASDLSFTILENPAIKVWVHGHIHEQLQYQVGDTWVLCNPRGYYGYETRAMDFNVLEFEIENDVATITKGKLNHD
jgi:predicted phosphohydrolase